VVQFAETWETSLAPDDRALSSVTLSDTGDHGERAPTRRYARRLAIQAVPLWRLRIWVICTCRVPKLCLGGCPGCVWQRPWYDMVRRWLRRRGFCVPAARCRAPAGTLPAPGSSCHRGWRIARARRV